MLENIYIINERYRDDIIRSPSDIQKSINKEKGKLKDPVTGDCLARVNVVGSKASTLITIVGLYAQKAINSLKIYFGLGITAKTLQGRVKKQIHQETHLMGNQERNALRSDIRDFIKKEGLSFPEEQMDEIVDSVVATYATTKQYYGPVVIEWAKSLLDTALKEKSKIVFLARDGGAPYEVAKKLKQMQPMKYRDVEISYLYFSRKVVKSADKDPNHPDILTDYVKQHGIKNEDRVIMVDVGFLGSMIPKIRHLLRKMKLDLQFQYLVSMNPNAKGFLSNLNVHLESIPCNRIRGAAGNGAAYWLEDTHQGVINSAKKLVKHGNKVYPDCFDGEKWLTCKESAPFDYLHKHFGQLAIKDAVEDNSGFGSTEEPWQMASTKARRAFDDFCVRMKNEDRLLYVNHF